MWHVWPMYCEGCSSSQSRVHNIDSDVEHHVLCEAEDAIAEIAEWCKAHAVNASEQRARV